MLRDWKSNVMKNLKLLISLVLIISFMLSPVVIFAQSNLLPEKTTSSSEEKSTADSTTNTLSSDTANKEKDETVFWATSVIVLLIIAFFFIFLEIAVIPGFGICGIGGGLFLIIGLILAFWKLSTNWAIAVTIMAIIGVFAIIHFVFFGLPHTKLGKKLILDQRVNPEESSAVENTSRYLGAEGVAISNLRPSGIAKIADDRVDVITEGDFLEKGTKIKVVKTMAGRVIVAAIEE